MGGGDHLLRPSLDPPPSPISGYSYDPRSNVTEAVVEHVIHRARSSLLADLSWVSMSHTQRVTFPTVRRAERSEKVKVSSETVQERSSVVLLPACRLLLQQPRIQWAVVGGQC